MSDINSESTTLKHAEAVAAASTSSSSNAQTSNSSNTNPNIHRSPQKKQNNKNVNSGGGRKRRYTVGTDVYKSYQKRRRKDDFEPPTVFKLGGNIHDPLNLNGINSNGGQSTPVSSPFPSPFPQQPVNSKVEVLIPPNICDPLNLSCPNALNESDLISPNNYHNFQSGRNRRNKRRRTSSENEIVNDNHKQRSGSFHHDIKTFRDDFFFTRRTHVPPSNVNNRSNRDKFNADRKISPVATGSAGTGAGGKSNHGRHFTRNNSQSNANRNHNHNHNNQGKNRQGPAAATSTTAPDPQSEPVIFTSTSNNQSKKNNKERFRFGNYNRYYGYRNASQHCDKRLELVPRDLIQGLDVLDVGCNIGHVTLTLARDYGPRRIVGVDIDPSLIEVAKKNVRHYITEAVVQQEEMPISMPLLYGPLANLPKQHQGGEGFPNNVFFLALNYVPESDALLEVQTEEYDTIICLSLTKWIHLNWGDAGIKRLFQRAYRQLRPGGCLILEPQPWSSYQKKAKITSQILNTYRSIRLRPEQFTEYLLKDVGFKSCELLGTPKNNSKGFQRPIYMYKKAVAPKSAAATTVSASTSACTTTSSSLSTS